MTRSIDVRVYDTFVSYNNRDRDLASALATRLANAGVRVFLDMWCLIPGEPCQEALEEAMTHSMSCLVLLGANGLGSWQSEEARSSIEQRVHNRRFRMIPVLLPGHTGEPRAMPPFLRRYAACDLRAGLDNHHEFARLLAGIHACGRPVSGASVLIASSCSDRSRPVQRRRRPLIGVPVINRPQLIATSMRVPRN